MLSLTLRLAIFGTVAAICWAAFGAFREGRPTLAALLPLVIIGLHASTLALEFVLLRVTAAKAGASVPAFRALLRAWSNEVAIAVRVFCLELPFREHRWHDQLKPPSNEGLRGVVLVHGYICNRGIWNRWLARLTAQGTPFVAVTMEPVLGGIDDCIPAIESAVAKIEACTGQAPVIVAHSMGGLAVRAWWCSSPPKPAATCSPRVHRLITLGTPHHGTWMAQFGFDRNARQMRQGSEWLSDLHEREPASHREATTCFYSACDNMVFPALTATLQDAANRPLEGAAHVAMLDRPEPYDELQQWLESATGRGE